MIQLRVVGVREAREGWTETVAAVGAGDHALLVRNAAVAAVIVPLAWYRSACARIGEPDQELRDMVGVQTARSNWAATIRSAEENGLHVMLLRQNTPVAYLIPVTWYAKATEALGELALKLP